MSVNGDLSGGVVVGLVPQNFFRLTSAFLRQRGFLFIYHTHCVAVAFCGFVGVVLTDFFMSILFSWIAVFLSRGGSLLQRLLRQQ